MLHGLSALVASTAVPNIKQQKRRVESAAKAAAQRAIHPNKAARKKSQAARLIAGQR